jgi:hypothetical protein
MRHCLLCGLKRVLAVAIFLMATGAGPCQAADVVVYGATPGGIVTAVRAAREGLKVTLVSTHPHVGGLLSNGLGLFDTVYLGQRAPLYDEVYRRIMSHYPSDTFGFEPHVAEKVFESLLRAEANIKVYRNYYPVSVVRNGRILQRVNFRSFAGMANLNLEASAFVDASYEGDLAAVSGVAMTVGREAREQYGEPHAGVVFTTVVPTSVPHPYSIQALNLYPFPMMTSAPMAGSTGAADNAVQAYNFRVILTNDASNRIPISKPARYERDLYQRLFVTGKGQAGPVYDLPDLYPLPNRKADWNAPELIEGNFQYPEGSWELRQKIIARHRDLALGYLWFLQHDSLVSPEIRAVALKYGLPKDEFQDNGGFPREIYVREARRMIGRYVFTEHDGKLAPGSKRSPVHEDSIAITEWPIDSHPTHWSTVEGSYFEGKVLLGEETQPGQIPFRALLPKEFDNLLVTVCVSSSHIGWGTIRVEPTWMHLGESAAHAIVLAHTQRRPPAQIPVPQLQRILVERGIMITFFNDVRYEGERFAPEDAAAQLDGVRGLFPSYWSRRARSATE